MTFLKSIIDTFKTKISSIRAKYSPQKEYSFAELDVIEEIADNSEAFYNVPISDVQVLPLILIGGNGVFIFADYGSDFNKASFRALKTKVEGYFQFGGKTSIWGISEASEGIYLIDEHNSLVEINDLISQFANYYHNSFFTDIEKLHLCIESTEDMLLSDEELEYRKQIFEEDSIIEEEMSTYIPVISDDMLDYYIRKIELAMDGANLKNIRYDEEGNEYRKHSTTFMGLATGEAYYRVDNTEPEPMFLATLIGGVFGLHHFLRGNIGKGLLYLFTGGGFGVLYISDVVQMATGNYHYNEVKYGNDEHGNMTRNKETVYLKPVKDKKAILASIPISVAIGVCITVFAIFPVYSKATTIFSSKANDIVYDAISSQIEEINPIRYQED